MANRTNHKPNAGSFQKGHDPRRMNADTFKTGQEVRKLAKAHTARAIAVLAERMEDDEEKGSNRIAAANALLNRAWGTPVNAIAIATSSDQPVDKMSRDELDQAIANALGISGNTLEGEIIEEKQLTSD